MLKTITLITLFTYLFVACEESGDSAVSDALDEAFNTDPTASGQVQIGQCYEDQYAPVADTITRKLDIILVPDTSGSINEERASIANGFTSFINSLPAEIDFRIGVVLGHGPNSARSGKLYQKGSEDLVLDSQILDTASIISGIHTKLVNPATDGASDGGEMGFLSLTEAITTNLGMIRSQGLLRDDAALAIVFIADEQDICADFPEGVIPVLDPQGKETSSYNNHCVDGDDNLLYYPEQLFEELNNLQEQRPLIIGGVIYNNNETIPFNGENEIGYGYKELIELSNGISVDLANGDYNDGLENLGKMAQVSVKPEQDFQLSTNLLEPSSLEVLVNGSPANHTYDAELNIVSLTSERDPFSVVRINYCEKEEVPNQVFKLVAGGSHTCAILHDGSLKCWGQNTSGQLGQGNTDTIGDDELPSSAMAINFGQKVVDAAAGLSHTCVLLEDQTVKCFGDNSRGQLGLGHTDNIGDNETADTFASVPLGTAVKSIYAGTRFNCALLINQEVKCWGENNFGQLGYGHTDNLGDDEDLSSYGNLALGDDVIQMDISTISYHTCAVLKSSNSLKCWGLNNQGQLGHGHTDNLGDDETPDSYGTVAFGNEVLQIATGASHTCALSSGQQVRCWGANSVGQTGFGSNTTIGDDEAADSAPYLDFDGADISMVATGNTHTCAIGTDDSLHCFGLAVLGQLGHGNKNNIGDNESITGNSKVEIDIALSQVALGLHHTCALTKDEGRVICFGLNSFGQLGYGNKANIGDDEVPWEFVAVLAPEEYP